MKCIQHVMDKPDGLPVIILRVDDDTAHQRVTSGAWKYVSKSAWKQNQQDWKAVEDVEFFINELEKAGSNSPC